MKAFLLTLLLITTAMLSVAEGKRETPVTEVHFALGTVCTITLYEETDGFSFDAPFALIDDIEAKMSVQIESSEVSAINAASGKEMISVSDDTFFVISEGVRYGELSDGLFDITVWPLADLWSIGTEWQRVPAPEEIAEAVGLIDYRSVLLQPSNNGVKLLSPGMELDLGGIAKGYAADVVMELLVGTGFTRGILNFGGNVLTFGEKPSGEPWKVGVQNPLSDRGEYLGIIETSARAVVTSGVYERYFELDGVRYHHILDTSTGMPVDNELLSVTIVAEDATTADALSTVAFAMGLERGMSFIESMAHVEAVFVTESFEVFTSTGIARSFILSDRTFTLGSSS